MSLSLTPELLFILLGATCLFIAIASSKDKPLEIYVLKVPGLEKANRIAIAVLGLILIVFPFIPAVRSVISFGQPTPSSLQPSPSTQIAPSQMQSTPVSVGRTVL